MKNILVKETKEEIFKRIDSLTPADKALWGKMNAAQAVCHMTDQIRIVEGTKTSSMQTSLLRSTLLKWLILWGMPAPKGKVETFKEIKQGEGGTKPKDFNQDKALLKKMITEFSGYFNNKSIVTHPAFGKMNKSQWARLAFIHLNYHLQQFGR